MSNKEEWLERLTFKREELIASMEGLSEAGWTTGEVLPGWTAKDVLAHIAAWETRVATLLPDLEPKAPCGLADSVGRHPAGDPDSGRIGVEADAFNAEQVALRRERTPRELLDELADSRRRIQETCSNASDDDLVKPRTVPWGQITIERWALREICDHDGEHAAQLRAWRVANPGSGRSLWNVRVDEMAAERAGLLFACLGQDANTLTSTPVAGEWTSKDILAHLAAWDDVHTVRAEFALAGREAEIAKVEVNERNAEIFAQRRGWSLDDALQATIDSRQRCLDIFGLASPEQLIRPLHLPWRETSLWEFARWRARHDAVHAAQIRAWRDAHSSPFSPGPRSVLLAAMDATRDDLVRQIDRIPPEGRETCPVIGHWMLKDVLGHMADWDLFALKALLLIQESHPLPYVAESDVDRINVQQIAARRKQTLDQAWAEFHGIRAELIDTLANWDDAQLAREVDYPSEWGRTAYGWVVGQTVCHDREHADALRAL